MLDLAVVLALASTCAPQADASTLAAIAYVESRFDPLAIGVNEGGRSARRPRDAGEAARIARAMIARGADIDLGLAQINSANLEPLDLTVEAAFDPCANLEAASRVLRDGYDPSGPTSVDRQQALRVALSRYNTGHARRGFANGYVGRVEAAAARLGLMRATAFSAEPNPAPGAWLISPPAAAGILVFTTGTGSERDPS